MPVCTDCGTYGSGVDVCKSEGHRVEHVSYEIGGSQSQLVAKRRVEDLKRHGRRLLNSN